MIALPAAPGRLYRMYLNAREHATACGGWGKASIAPKPGGRMAMTPHITGRFLRLVPGRMIVQTWRGSNWKKADLDSVLLLRFDRVRGGTRLTMVHPNVPDANAKSIGSRTSGWHKHYWQPWKAYLSKRRPR